MRIALELKGLEQFQQRITDLQSRAKGLEDPSEVAFRDLFPPDFMSAHTQHSSIDGFFAAGGFKVQNKEDFDHIRPELDAFVAQQSNFPAWPAMQTAGATQYVKKKLGF